MNPLSPRTAIVQQAEETEEQLIQAARTAIVRESDCKWEVGSLAHEWTQKHASGRTDADFAELIGLSRVQVSQRRLTFEAFGDICNTYYKLSWSHFNVAIDWGDAKEWLAEANQQGWSVSTMKLKREEAAAKADRARLNLLSTKIDIGIQKLIQVGIGLKKVRDRRLYRGKYRTFEEHALEQHDITPKGAAMYIAASEAVVALTTQSEIESAHAENRPIRFKTEDDRRKASGLLVEAYFSD
jgi:hypothetical protein